MSKIVVKCSHRKKIVKKVRKIATLKEDVKSDITAKTDENKITKLKIMCVRRFYNDF